MSRFTILFLLTLFFNTRTFCQFIICGTDNKNFIPSDTTKGCYSLVGSCFTLIGTSCGNNTNIIYNTNTYTLLGAAKPLSESEKAIKEIKTKLDHLISISGKNNDKVGHFTYSQEPVAAISTPIESNKYYLGYVPPKNISTNDTILLLIDKIDLQIMNGVIKHIYVYTKTRDGNARYTFTNQDAPLPINEYFLRKDDKLYDVNTKSNLHIKIGDALIYETTNPQYAIPNNDYFFTLESKAPQKEIEVGKGLSQLVDAAIFTDFNQLAFKSNNGYIHTEISPTLMLHTRNIKNRFGYLFQTVKPFLWYTVYGERSDTINFSNTDFRIKVQQQAFLRFGTMMSIYNFSHKHLQYTTFDIKAGYLGAITRSNNKSADYLEHVLSHNIVLEPVILVRPVYNFGAEFGGRLMWNILSRENVLNKHYYTINYPNELGKLVNRNTTYDTDTIIDKSVTNDYWFFQLMVNLYYFPNEDKHNKIFFRAIYTKSFQESGDYVQMQIGYSANLNDIIKR
ncbi:MAG: hypothetical protein NW207_03390 [Cytophagales bacterium]|nr:hypothetical protein [Cytophagales bacterium]